MENKFGDFDLNRELTTYEMENFEEFIAIKNNDFNASDVPLDYGVQKVLESLKEKL